MAGARLKAVEVPKAMQWAKKVNAARIPMKEAQAEHATAWSEFKDDPDYHKVFKHCLQLYNMDLTARAEALRKRDQFEAELGLRDQLPLPLGDVDPAA